MWGEGEYFSVRENLSQMTKKAHQSKPHIGTRVHDSRKGFLKFQKMLIFAESLSLFLSITAIHFCEYLKSAVGCYVCMHVVPLDCNHSISRYINTKICGCLFVCSLFFSAILKPIEIPLQHKVAFCAWECSKKNNIKKCF